MDEDDAPLLLFINRDNINNDPCHLVESLPPIYDKRLDMFRYEVQFVAMRVCDADRVDLVEKLLKGEYVGVNEKVWCGSTLLGFANSIEMAELLIKHGALFKVLDFDCFYYYIILSVPHMLEHFFNHPQFIYRDDYMKLAIHSLREGNRELVIEILRRKRAVSKMGRIITCII